MATSVSYVLRLIIIALLLGCLAKMPYGYYQFVRLSTFVMFLVLAFQENEKKRLFTMVMCVAFAILFNPIFKVYFKRTIWNIIDVVITCGIVIWLAIDVITVKKKTNG